MGSTLHSEAQTQDCVLALSLTVTLPVPVCCSVQPLRLPAVEGHAEDFPSQVCVAPAGHSASESMRYLSEGPTPGCCSPSHACG